MLRVLWTGSCTAGEASGLLYHPVGVPSNANLPACPLQVFLNRVASHPTLKESAELRTFLTATDEAWMLEMAKWQAETAAQHRPVSAAAQWFKSLQHSAQTLVSGRGEEIQEDPEYIKVRTCACLATAHPPRKTLYEGIRDI